MTKNERFIKEQDEGGYFVSWQVAVEFEKACSSMVKKVRKLNWSHDAMKFLCANDSIKIKEKEMEKKTYLSGLTYEQALPYMKQGKLCATSMENMPFKFTEEGRYIEVDGEETYIDAEDMSKNTWVVFLDEPTKEEKQPPKEVWLSADDGIGTVNISAVEPELNEDGEYNCEGNITILFNWLDQLEPGKKYKYVLDKLEPGAKKHLQWLSKRLINLHNENPEVDYMMKLSKIINSMEE